MVLKVILIIIEVLAGYLLFMILIGVRILRKFVHFPAPPFNGKLAINYTICFDKTEK